jgi:hypothetical protein
VTVVCGNVDSCLLCTASAIQAGQWKCSGCKQPYDLEAIEGRLLCELQAANRAYQLQDLECNKCKQARSTAQHIDIMLARSAAQEWHQAYKACCAGFGQPPKIASVKMC